MHYSILRTYVRTYISKKINTYIYTYTYIHSYVRTYVIHTYIHTCIHTYIYTYVHNTCIHRDTKTNVRTHLVNLHPLTPVSFSLSRQQFVAYKILYCWQTCCFDCVLESATRTRPSVHKHTRTHAHTKHPPTYARTLTQSIYLPTNQSISIYPSVHPSVRNIFWIFYFDPVQLRYLFVACYSVAAHTDDLSRIIEWILPITEPQNT